MNRRTLLSSLLLAKGGWAQSPRTDPRLYFDAVRDMYPVRTGIKRLSRRDLTFPRLGEYQVVTGDFHVHTLYSEGTVMPSVRLYEAWTEGVDAVAITDHAEFLRTSLPEKKGRAYAEVRELAEAMNLVLIRGAEVSTVYSAEGERMADVASRDNTDFIVLFVRDENALFAPFDVAMERARQQGCVNIWAHPGKVWRPIPQRFLDAGWLHGIEVRNTGTAAGTGAVEFRGSYFYPEAAEWARDMKLAVFASSDVHAPAQFERAPGKDRDFTLLFVKERSSEGVREAILARRTLAWFDGMLWGSEENLRLLAEASIGASAMVTDGKLAGLLLRNTSSIPFEVEVDPEGKSLRLPPRKHALPPLGSAIVPVTSVAGGVPSEVALRIANAFSSRDANPAIRCPLHGRSRAK